MTPGSILFLLRRWCAAPALSCMPQGILGLPLLAGPPASSPCYLRPGPLRCSSTMSY